MSSRAVFLDRDGTLIEEVGFLQHIDRMTLFPWTIDAVRLLNRAGFKVIVLTNQSGIARGFFDEVFVESTHRYLSEKLAAGGASIDAYYYCPHHPEGSIDAYRTTCECRKPQPGLARQAARDLKLDLHHSFVVGDRRADLELAYAVGAHGILVRTGYGSELDPVHTGSTTAAAIVANLMAAVGWILRKNGH